MIKTNLKLTLLVLLSCLFSTTVLSFSSEATKTGRQLFAEHKCSRCHTLGRGRFVGPDLANISDKYKKYEIVRWITRTQEVYDEKGKKPVNKGYPSMPPVSVPDEQAGKIADYLLNFEIKADEDDKGTITGIVYNYSRDGEPVNGAELVLYSYMGDRKMNETASVTGSSGNFGFEDLQWNRSYAVSVLYRGAQYTTDRMVFQPEQTEIELELPVYEPTNNKEDISVRQHHIVIDITEDKLNVIEVIDLINSGKHIFTGSRNDNLNIDKETMVITLAEDAANVSLIQGLSRENLIINNNKIHDTSGITPGLKRIAIGYEVPSGKNSITISKSPYFYTNNMLVLVGDSQYKVSVDRLEKGENVSFNNQDYIRWQGTDLTPDENVTIKLEVSLFDSFLSTRLIPVFIFILVLSAGIIYNILVRKRRLAS